MGIISLSPMTIFPSEKKTNPADKWKECWFGVLGAMPCERVSVRIESDDHSNTDFLIDFAVPIGWL